MGVIRWCCNFIGLYPTWETFGSQLFITALVVFLWNLGNKVMKKPICETDGKEVVSVKKELAKEGV